MPTRVIFEKKDGTREYGVVGELRERVRLVKFKPPEVEIYNSYSVPKDQEVNATDYQLTDIYEGIIAVYKEI